MSASAPIPFIDLRPGDDAAAVRHAIDRVVASGWFVLGPEVERFEAAFAAACAAPSAIGVASGTDAISLALRALDIGAGDEVIVPAMTAAYTGLAVIATGARPVIVDVERDTLTIDPAACAAAVTSRTRAIVPVHLYGQPANMAAVRLVAERHSLAIVEDCCQAHLATETGVPVGTRSDAAAFSFYPTKNLGALGDGGAVITGTASLADRIRRLRNGGMSRRYYHAEAGVNSRLDELQAAVLAARLPRLAEWTARRRTLAAIYRHELPPWISPVRERDPGHVYHLFAVRVPDRDVLRSHLDAAGIETLIHYPFALTEQPAFSPFGSGACPVAEAAARDVLSLPLYPRLTDQDAIRVAREVEACWKGQRPA
ncbi:MAG TPA: DegT/DnrJ/EryC1/StrS family aminotransferase [Vicinamibacterales bacterium]|nr:DegT/DnrJ/EryC1/StrS family aminotransferase [Vicinamibacterales bacterium]